MSRKIKKLFYSIIITLIFFFTSKSLALALDISIRVLVYKGKEFSITGKSLTLYIKNNEQIRLESLSKITGRLEGLNLILEVSGESQNTQRFELENRSVIEVLGKDITVNSTTYRGGLKIINRNDNILIINILSIEEYLYGVVPAEVPYYWPIEALKAQAVLARTYALKCITNSAGKDYDLENTQNSQVYKGKNGEHSTTTEAVNSTMGEVIFYNNNIASIYFHSTCGGHTESAKNVWNTSTFPYLVGVECPYCSESSWSGWERSIKREEWDKIIKGGEIEIEYDSSGRILRLNGVDGTKIRSVFNLPSTLIIGIEIRDKEVIIKGKGYGHGVGVCQWGMKKMAELGFSYKDIILYYLPGVTIDAYRRF